MDDGETLGPLQVHHEALLATIRDLEGLRVTGNGGTEEPERLTARRLYFDHLGTEVGEMDTGVRSGEDQREFQDADAVQRPHPSVRPFRHRSRPSCERPPFATSAAAS